VPHFVYRCNVGKNRANGFCCDPGPAGRGSFPPKAGGRSLVIPGKRSGKAAPYGHLNRNSGCPYGIKESVLKEGTTDKVDRYYSNVYRIEDVEPVAGGLLQSDPYKVVLER